ncbi:MAG: hypothetical protein LBC19_11425 [Tannerella sp.]|jgi:hypothetical protein|nr:hypothetical protein [Tannerella sp.]
MKQTFSIILSAMICFISCKEGNRTIDRPIFSVRNTNTLEIDKIVLTDTATIFYIDAFYYPKNWIRIDSLTYLQAGDRKYFITGSEDIELSKDFWMPESGEASFVLLFPPIERELEKIDFIESDCDDCFKIYGIDLTGKASYTVHPEGLPQELCDTQPDMSVSLPEAELKIGTTHINLHLPGYRKGMDNGKVTMYNIRFFPSVEDEIIFPIDENTGDASIEFEQYGTMQSIIRAAGQLIRFVSSPGETMDIYVDLQECGRQGARYHKSEYTPNPVFYFTGKNAAINQALNHKNDKYKLQLQSGDTYNKIVGMNADEFTEYVISEYKDITETINQSAELSTLEKELIDAENKVMVHYFLLTGENQLDEAFRIKNKLPGDQRELKNYKTPEFTGKHYDIIKDIRIDGTKCLYTEMFSYIYPMYFSGKTNLELITGQKEGLLYDLRKVHRLSHKIEEMEPLTDKEKAELATIKNPFYANVLNSLDKKLQKQLEEAKSKT